MGEAKRRREVREACRRLADSGTDKEVFDRLDVEWAYSAEGHRPLLALLTCRAEDAGRTCLRGTEAGRLAERALRLLGAYRKQRLTKNREEK